MKQFIYKMLITVIGIILIYEFTIGKVLTKYTDQLDYISTKDGRKDLVNTVKNEIQKGLDKENYFSKEEAKLINDFINKIKKELNEAESN